MIALKNFRVAYREHLCQNPHCSSVRRGETKSLQHLILKQYFIHKVIGWTMHARNTSVHTPFLNNIYRKNGALCFDSIPFDTNSFIEFYGMTMA